MAVLKPPDGLPRESLNTISETVNSFNDAHALLGSFTKEVRTEFGDMHEQLWAIHRELERDLDEFVESTKKLGEDRAAFEKECRTADQLSQQLEATHERLEESKRHLQKVQSELQECQSRLVDVETEKNSVRDQLTDVLEEMSVLSELVDLVKGTHDELVAAQAENQFVRQQIREECEKKYALETQHLRKKLQDLEHEHELIRLKSDDLTEQLRSQEHELQGYREKWTHELDRVQSLLNSRVDLLELQKPAARQSRVGGTTRLIEQRHNAPQPTAEVEPASEPLRASDNEPTETPTRPADPVIGSVLAEFARLNNGNNES